MDFTAKNFAKEVSSIVLRKPEYLYEWLGKERLTRQKSADSKQLNAQIKARRRTTFKNLSSTIGSALQSVRGSARGKLLNSKTLKVASPVGVNFAGTGTSSVQNALLSPAVKKPFPVEDEFEETPSERSETDTSTDEKFDPPVLWRDLSRDQKRIIQNVRHTSVKLRRILSFDHNDIMRDQTRSLIDLQKMVDKAHN